MSTQPIVIVCRDHSHPTKTEKIATFELDGERWRTLATNTSKAWKSGRKPGQDDAVKLIAATPEPRPGQQPRLIKGSQDDQAGPGRDKVDLACDLCGLSLRTTYTRLAPMLDTVLAGGVSEIPLTFLIARLT